MNSAVRCEDSRFSEGFKDKQHDNVDRDSDRFTAIEIGPALPSGGTSSAGHGTGDGGNAQ